MSRERIYTSHHMDIAESLFTHGGRIARTSPKRSPLPQNLETTVIIRLMNYMSIDTRYLSLCVASLLVFRFGVVGSIMTARPMMVGL